MLSQKLRYRYHAVTWGVDMMAERMNSNDGMGQELDNAD